MFDYFYFSSSCQGGTFESILRLLCWTYNGAVYSDMSCREVTTSWLNIPPTIKLVHINCHSYHNKCSLCIAFPKIKDVKPKFDFNYLLFLYGETYCDSSSQIYIICNYCCLSIKLYTQSWKFMMSYFVKLRNTKVWSSKYFELHLKLLTLDH